MGCDQCNHTGYRGRIGIYEVMKVTDKLRRLITIKSTEDQLREAAVAGGMITLGEDGLAKVKSGITTPEELLRVVTEVGEMRTLCAGCGSAVGVDFNACPQCGKRVSGGCPHCGRAMQPGWNVCPYCARSASEVKARAPKRLRDRERDAAKGVASCPPRTLRSSRNRLHSGTTTRHRTPRRWARSSRLSDQRRKSRGAKVTLIPVDARVWNAHMPLDAPVIAKTLAARLKSGT